MILNMILFSNFQNILIGLKGPKVKYSLLFVCFVALKAFISQSTQSRRGSNAVSIMLRILYNLDALTVHFYMVILGFTEVYIGLIVALKH